MNIFIDIEFNRETQTINSIGATYGKNRFCCKQDKYNKNPEQIINKLYNFLPSKTECLFFFFGKEDIRVLKSNRNKYEFSDVINKMLDNIISNSVDLRQYISPIQLSLAEVVNELGLSVCKPLHDPLSDAINLQTLYEALKTKRIISKLIKIAGSTKLSTHFETNLKTLFSLKPSYAKDSKSIQTKIILINKENGHQYILNDISQDNLSENKFYKIKTPKMLLEYTGIKKECVICILENIDSASLTMSYPEKLLYENIGMDLEFCKDFVQELWDKGFIVKLSPNTYQISEQISFMDTASSRRILIDDNIKNKISIIC